MNQYSIKYSHSDMPKGYIGSSMKWARDEKEAIKLVFRNRLDRNKCGTLKRGGYGKLIEIIKVQ